MIGTLLTYEIENDCLNLIEWLGSAYLPWYHMYILIDWNGQSMRSWNHLYHTEKQKVPF